MKQFFKGVLCLATLAAVWLSTPEAQAQRRGGGSSRGGANVRFSVGPSYGYRGYDGYRGSDWYGRGYYSGYSPYRSYYYRDYPRSYYVYPSTWYEEYPTTTQTYESYYPPVQATTTARIHVRVEDPNAEIWFNGTSTRQRGTERAFDTPPMTSGYRHTYEIRARWMGPDGQMIDRTRTIDVQPGQELTVDFG